MAKVIKSIIAISLSVVFLSFQAGCAARYSTYYLPPPLSEEERARLGTIGIVSADFVPEPKLFTYARGRVKGAAEGMAFETSTGGPHAMVPPGAAVAVLLGLIIVPEYFSEKC